MKTFICPIRKASALAVAGLFVSVANATAATTAATPVDNILVTATRTSQTLAETMAQAVIISRDDIEAAGMVSLAELLQRRAGVEIRATGGPGQPASVFMRGANGAHTLVLIDGMRVGSSTSGATALENIAPDLQYAYEVVRGAGIDGKHDGIIYKNVLACYAHMRDLADNHWARRFIDYVRQQCQIDAARIRTTPAVTRNKH